MIDRRRLLIAGAAALAPSAARAAFRPARPVTVVVPYPAGGGTDVLARLLSHELAAAFEGTFVVENTPGASGAVGSRRVAKAEPDGLTLLVTTNQTHATNVTLLKDGGGYDPVGDFTVIGGVADLQHVLVVRPDLEAHSVKELLALAKAGPKLTCASTGIGSASHLTMELFKARTDVDFVHVPYRGAAPLLQDMIGGRIDLAFATVPTVLGQVQADILRGLAVASPAASPQLRAIPTLAQEGIQGVEADAWIAVFAPAKLPADIRADYAQAIGQIMGRPQIRTAITEQGMLPNWREPKAFAAFQKDDIQRWAGIIRAANVAGE